MVSETMGGGSVQVGTGVTASTIRNFTQGPVQSTGQPLDAAIQGSGFFVTKDANNQTVYTRVGNFKLNSNGFLVDQSGSQVQGWNATNGVVDVSKTAGPLQLSVGALLPPQATTQMTWDLNLNSQASATDPSFPAPMNIVDSLGISHVVTVNFTKDATTPNTWHYTVANLDSGETPTLASGGGTLTFDNTGKLIGPTPASDTINITGLADGAKDMSISWNFLDQNNQPRITQFASPSALSAMNQDGYEAAELTQVAISGGTVVAQYSNGKQQVAGQLAVASIRNPDTLQSVGNNGFVTTTATAPPALGMANTGGRGQVLGGSIEGSNVDIAKEFTNLIVYQRGYQAAAKVITTADELSQQTIELIR
jgi:flagellar hook protein FlgE